MVKIDVTKLLILAVSMSPSSFASDCKTAQENKIFIEENTCPNHCELGKWTAKSDIEVRNEPEGKIVGKIKANEEFQALKGQTHVLPSKFTVISIPPNPNLQLKIGHTFHLLSYHGEGDCAACINGKLQTIGCNGSADPLPWARRNSGQANTETWWVQVKSAKLVGWIAHDFALVKGSTYAEPGY